MKRVTWKEAKERLCACRQTIQRYALGELRRKNPKETKAGLKAILEQEGVQFNFFGTTVWVASRGHRRVIKL